MFVAHVVGTVVASRKVEGLTGKKMLLVQAEGEDGQPQGMAQVAVDVVQAGEGDRVTCVGSREAALALVPSFVPVDLAIIGIIDQVDP